MFSQELSSPFLINYNTKDYKFGYQNFSIAEDQRGILYFANNKGVLEYNGKTWRRIYIENNLTVRTLKVDRHGIIYVGATGAFGYLAPDTTGSMQYYSISAKFDNSIIKTPPDVQGINIINDEVYFNTPEALYRYSPYSKNKIEDKIKVWYPGIKSFSTYNINNKFYISDQGVGLLEMKKDSLIFAPNGAEFSGHIICSMVPVSYNKKSDDIIIAMRNKLIKYNTKTGISEKLEFSKFHTKADSIFIKHLIYSVVSIPKNRFAIGTYNKGIVIIDNKGDIIDIINSENGLQKASVLALHYSKNSLWIGLDNGISQIEINSPYRIFDVAGKISGNITSMAKFNNTVFVGTTKGVFYTPDSTKSFKNVSSQFQQVIGIEEEIQCMLNYTDEKNNKTLIIGQTDEVLEIDKEFNLNYIMDNTVLSIFQSKRKRNVVFAGGFKNFFILKQNIKSKNWNVNTIQGFHGKIKSIAEDYNSIWLATYYNGLYKIIINSNKDYDKLKPENYIIKHYDKSCGIEEMTNGKIYNIDNKIFFASTQGIFQYDKTKDKFYICDRFGEQFANGTYGAGMLISNNSGDIWVDRKGILYKQIDGNYVFDTIFAKRIPFTEIDDILPYKNKYWLLGGIEGIIGYNSELKYNYKTKFNVVIDKVSIKKDSVLFYGTKFKKDEISGILIPNSEQADIQEPRIMYENNTVNFKFSALFYIRPAYTMYSYKLENFDEKWSNWKEKNEKEYTNLPAGEYIFKVKAKNIYDHESSITDFKFKILPPWYETFWAYILYILVLIATIRILIKINTRQLIRTKKRLENEMHERISEIQNKNAELEQQKEEIQTQREKMEVANIELERLSVVARKTDNAIVITDKDGYFEWVNPAFTRIFGYGYGEFTESKSINIIGENTPENIKELIEKCVKEKKTIEYELEAISKDNKKIWVHSTVTPILNEKGETEKLIIIDLDITKMKNVENALILQHSESMASLRYARAIQQAILPARAEMNNIFNNFVIYRPKDIVSGDFYWYTVAGYLTFIAVVDCTGHGVPGAFMSLIGNRLLNEIVNERGIYETDQILEELNKSIKRDLRQDKTDNKDGMDVALCRFEVEDDETIVSFTGAKRPIFIYEQQTRELIKIKGDRKTIGGKYFQKFNFTKSIWLLEKGDMIYLTTDGYVDQNNSDIKKFGTKRLTKLIEEIAELELPEQQRILENNLNNHQGNEIQRDDITIVGIKI